MVPWWGLILSFVGGGVFAAFLIVLCSLGGGE